jgi:hypothetical protein
MSFKKRNIKEEINIEDTFYKSEKAKATAAKNREQNQKRKAEKAEKQRKRNADKPPWNESELISVRREMLNRLGLEFNATIHDIKKSYHSLALLYHPDKFNGSDSNFKQILEAYEFLKQIGNN